MIRLNRFAKIVAIAIMLGVWHQSSAHSFEVEGIYYNVTSLTDKTVAVTYQGWYSEQYSNEYSGNVTIPETITYSGVTYSVTSIGDFAFEGCSSLTSVTIPNSVTSIGSGAFFNTWWYNNQPDGILYLDNCCLGYKKTQPTGKLTLNSNTRLIAGNAFSLCTTLTEVTIPNSVASIGDFAFSNCSGLTKVTIGNSVTSIGDFAFSDCESLTSIAVESENSVYDSRNNCNAIIETTTNTLITGCKNTTILNSVTSIGDDAFYGCTGLTSVTIPNSVTSIGYDAFDNTGWYNNQPDGILYLDNCCLGYKKTQPTGELALNSNTRLIASGAFEGCTSLTSVTIPDSVTGIGDYAFMYCSGLTSVTIPNSVTSIGYATFSLCTTLTEVTIPNSVASIGDFAFSNCSGLIQVNYNAENYTSINNSVIGSVFEYCPNLKILNIGNNVKIIPDIVFSGCSGLTQVTIPNSVTSIGSYAFDGCTGLTSITIPNSVTSIGIYAFFGCTNLTEVTIPNSVTSIGDCAFTSCSGLTSIAVERENSVYDSRDNCNAIIETTTNTLITGCKNTAILNSVTSIDNYAFYKCTDLTEVTIPNSVTLIGYGSFYDCSDLKSVIIGNSVASIGDFAFSKCLDLRLINVLNPKPPTCYSNTFAHYTSLLMIPEGTIVAYSLADVWCNFTKVTEVVGIEDIKADESDVIEAIRYDNHGRRLEQPTRGINIIKMSDGSTRKEIVR